MKQQPIWFAIVALALLTGCASGIKRSNYRVAETLDANATEGCQVAIKYKATFDRSRVDILGTIKAYDTGFSKRCDEGYVLGLFTADACALGADLVNIIEEQHPEGYSNCYKATAELVRFRDRGIARNLRSDSTYAGYYITERSDLSKERAKAKMRGAIIGGAVGGAVGGVIGAAVAGD